MTDTPKKEIVATEPVVAVEPVVVDNSVESLISLAITQKADVGTMERLLAMRKELKAEFAREEFNKDMAKFQAACPTIVKTKEVKNKDGSVRYKFAPIDVIVNQVKENIKKYGFSYSVTTKNDGTITAVCRVTHKFGHFEESEFTVPVDKEAYMNEAQKVASAFTFAKRYAFCNAFGILSGDEDDDSVESGTKPSLPPPPKKTPTKALNLIIEDAIRNTTDPENIKNLYEKIVASDKLTDDQKEELKEIATLKMDALLTELANEQDNVQA